MLAPLADRSHPLVGDFDVLYSDDLVGAPPPRVRARGDVAPRDRPSDRCWRPATWTVIVLHPMQSGYTYPADAPWLRLDELFTTPALTARLIADGVLDDATAARASDRLPVWARSH